LCFCNFFFIFFIFFVIFDKGKLTTSARYQRPWPTTQKDPQQDKWKD
jgi:hypothetical protein